ncbi:MAG TPA: DMT family transporter [Microbacteriaceae bacterium]|nr:DMT family transporter [Microbacteriaceae bacterium]
MGYLYALLGAALFGLNGSVTKVVVTSGITGAQLTFFRTMSIMVISGVWLLIANRSAFRISRRQIAIMALLGVVGVALMQWSYSMAVSLLPVGIALLIEYLSVLFVALVARFVFREQVRSRVWIAVALVIAGMVFVAKVWASTLDPLGVVYAFTAAVTLTVYFVIGERQVTATSPLAVAFWSMLFAWLFWLAFSGWWNLDPALLHSSVELGGVFGGTSAPIWFLIIWIGVVGSFMPFLLSFLALKHLPVTAAGIASSSEVLFAFLVAFLWLGEGLEPVQGIGAALVFVGILLAQTARANGATDADGISARMAANERLP